MPGAHSILIRKLKEHSRLTREDLAAIHALRHQSATSPPMKTSFGRAMIRMCRLS